MIPQRAQALSLRASSTALERHPVRRGGLQTAFGKLLRLSLRGSSRVTAHDPSNPTRSCSSIMMPPGLYPLVKIEPSGMNAYRNSAR
jgi:hypothetical protein